MNQDTFSLLDRWINKIENLIRSLVIRVEENLLVWIIPIICQVNHPNLVPVVLYLFPWAVYYMGYFVRDNEFQILKGKLKFVLELVKWLT